MVKRIPDIATYDILTQIITNGRAIPSQISTQGLSQIPSQMIKPSQSNDTRSNDGLSTSGSTSAVIPVMKVTELDIATRMVSGMSFPSQIPSQMITPSQSNRLTLTSLLAWC